MPHTLGWPHLAAVLARFGGIWYRHWYWDWYWCLVAIRSTEYTLLERRASRASGYAVSVRSERSLERESLGVRPSGGSVVGGAGL
jgi:hypothetical protein